MSIKGNGRRLSPEEIRARFANMRQEHEAKVEESRKAREAHQFLRTSRTTTVAPSMGEALRTGLKGVTLRDPKGRFMGIPKSPKGNASATVERGPGFLPDPAAINCRRTS